MPIFNHGVGYLKPKVELQSTTAQEGLGGGGHYITARMCYPQIDQFVAAGYTALQSVQNPPDLSNDPRYVRFGN